jgi:hypothetical protein
MIVKIAGKCQSRELKAIAQRSHDIWLPKLNLRPKTRLENRLISVDKD